MRRYSGTWVDPSPCLVKRTERPISPHMDVCAQGYGPVLGRARWEIRSGAFSPGRGSRHGPAALRSRWLHTERKIACTRRNQRGPRRHHASPSARKEVEGGGRAETVEAEDAIRLLTAAAVEAIIPSRWPTLVLTLAPRTLFVGRYTTFHSCISLVW